MHDIQFTTDSGMFNCRVVGVCVKENRFFLSKLKSDDYWTFIGGKPQFGESSDTAILREYCEETGAQLQTDHLLAVIENFFVIGDKPWHQYIFFYMLRDDNDVLKFFDGERAVNDNCEAVYKWFELSELENINIKPDCSNDILQNLSANTRHYINRDG